MNKLTLPFLLIALAALAATAPAAPIPDELKTPVLHATKVGTKWVYTYGEEERTEVVTAASTKAGVTTISIEVWSKGEKTSSGQLAVSAAGVAEVGRYGKVYDHPVWLVKASARPGDRLNEPGKDNPLAPFRIVMLAGGVEDVAVPAGRFRAVRVDKKLVGRASSRTMATFYAPGVGVVKVAMRSDEEKWEPGEVLKSFTPGRE